MLKRLSLFSGMILVLGVGTAAYAAHRTPTPVETRTVPKPIFLTPQEKISDKTKYHLPKPPFKSINGAQLNLANDEDEPPQGPMLQEITDALTAQQIQGINKAEKDSWKYYWHALTGLNFCHLREGDRQWFGWSAGWSFHWILWKSGHFWWRDNYTERWLCFDRGYWWWQGLQAPNQVQVFLKDGHYHSCDANGVLGEDLMRTGTEETVTKPVADSTPNKSSGGRKGGRRGGNHRNRDLENVGKDDE